MAGDEIVVGEDVEVGLVVGGYLEGKVAAVQ